MYPKFKREDIEFLDHIMVFILLSTHKLTNSNDHLVMSIIN